MPQRNRLLTRVLPLFTARSRPPPSFFLLSPHRVPLYPKSRRRLRALRKVFFAYVAAYAEKAATNALHVFAPLFGGVAGMLRACALSRAAFLLAPPHSPSALLPTPQPTTLTILHCALAVTCFALVALCANAWRFCRHLSMLPRTAAARFKTLRGIRRAILPPAFAVAAATGAAMPGVNAARLCCGILFSYSNLLEPNSLAEPAFTCVWTWHFHAAFSPTCRALQKTALFSAPLTLLVAHRANSARLSAWTWSRSG